MAAVTVHSDFGAHGNKVCNCFYFYPIYEVLVLDGMILGFGN